MSLPLLTTKKAQAETAIEAIIDGRSLREAVQSAGLSVRELQRLFREDRELAVAYLRAQECRADILADEALQIADTSDDAAKARNQITIRQWLASKLHQRKYGDRIDLNVTQTIDVSSTLAEARARLRPASYQHDVIDVQPVDYQSQTQSQLSDKQSFTPGDPPDAVPSIFD